VLLALWGWMGAIVVISLFAMALGAPARTCGLAAALGLAPALATLLLTPRWGQNWAGAIAIDSWTAAAAAAVALTGGVASPLSALFLVGPALALRLGGASRAGDAAAIAVLGFALAALTGAWGGVAANPPAPGAFVVLALAFAGWLIAAPLTPAPRPRPAPEPEPRKDDAMVQRFAEAAHELRTPLGHIMGFAEIMQRQVFGPLPAKYAEYVDLIMESSRRMHLLASDWLDAGRLQAGRYSIHREEIDLARLVREAAEAARFAASAKDQRVSIVGADQETPFHADARALRQILDNLLANAVKFAPAGGAIVARLIPGPNAAILDVQDNGPGIPLAERERLGRAFERGLDVGGVEGAGLGLSIAAALAQAHGGRLDILDAEGGGALMRVVLPVVQAPG
jgi:signal transduction histidine kinase